MLLTRRHRGTIEKLEDWLIEAAGIMARTGQSLVDTAAHLERVLTSDEANAILRRASFNKLLWEARHRYWIEIARDPGWKKDSAVGRLMCLAQKLEDEGDHDKAAEVIFKAAKMAGWVGPESTVSVFGELSQRDLDSIRDSVAKDANKVN